MKNGFSVGSARTAGEGAGDCDHGDGGVCSYSSNLGVGGLGGGSSMVDKRLAIFVLSAERCFLLRLIE